ncbi:hypothetical protein BD769DRAFT_1675967 [Suillus cothurnatus]|nr:hypothetical protein BD769DRAFT_1675967 [Suillus cothurnatus]
MGKILVYSPPTPSACVISNNQVTQTEANVQDGDNIELMLTFEEALTAESASDAPTTQCPPLWVEASAPPLPQGHITDGNLFLVGDIFLTILQSGHTVSIGILRSMVLTLSNMSHASINAGVMKASRMTVKVTGQLLTIIPTNCPTSESKQLFLWNGGYVKVCSAAQGTSGLVTTDHVIILTVPGSLIKPINSEPTFLCLHDDINTNDLVEINGGQSTWWWRSKSLLRALCQSLLQTSRLSHISCPMVLLLSFASREANYW